MTTIEVTRADCVGPERPGGQGLDHHQEESGNLAIHKLLTTDDGLAWTDFVATARQDLDGFVIPPIGLEDSSMLPHLTMALATRGFRPAALAKILGENALRVLDAVPPRSRRTSNA